MAQRVKNLPAMQETQEMWAQPLGLKDAPEEENGNLLQYSCLKSPMDRGIWQDTVHGVTESGTQLSTQHSNGTLYKLLILYFGS